MAKHNKSMPFYSNGILYLPTGERINAEIIPLHGERTPNPAFIEWMKANDRFAFDDGLNGHCSLKKEQIKSKNASFWYAYAKIGGKTIKRYVGKVISYEMIIDRAAIEFRRLRRYVRTEDTRKVTTKRRVKFWRN